MLRMRLSLDCGCAAVATQGGSDNLFTVESLAALTRARSRGSGSMLPGTGALTDQTLKPKFASPFQKLRNIFRKRDRISENTRRLFQQFFQLCLTFFNPSTGKF
jgi:hypothetical protein